MTRAASLMETERSSYGSSRKRFWTVFAVAVSWWLGLVVLAVKTANPVTFNLVQLRSANLVIAATYDGAADETVSVDRTWPENAPVSSSMVIDGLDSLGLKNGKKYLIPVTLRSENGYEVTRILMPSQETAEDQSVQFVYPDSDVARTLLATTRSVLADRQSQKLK